VIVETGTAPAPTSGFACCACVRSSIAANRERARTRITDARAADVVLAERDHDGGRLPTVEAMRISVELAQHDAQLGVGIAQHLRGIDDRLRGNRAVASCHPHRRQRDQDPASRSTRHAILALALMGWILEKYS